MANKNKINLSGKLLNPRRHLGAAIPVEWIEDSFVSSNKSPKDALEYLFHRSAQIEMKSDDRFQTNELVNEIKKYSAKNCLSQVIVLSFALGRIVGKYDQVADEKIKNSSRIAVSKHKRVLTGKKNIQRSKSKEVLERIAYSMAESYWKTGEFGKYKIIDMCFLVEEKLREKISISYSGPEKEKFLSEIPKGYRQQSTQYRNHPTMYRWIRGAKPKKK